MARVGLLENQALFESGVKASGRRNHRRAQRAGLQPCASFSAITARIRSRVMRGSGSDPAWAASAAASPPAVLLSGRLAVQSCCRLQGPPTSSGLLQPREIAGRQLSRDHFRGPLGCSLGLVTLAHPLGLPPAAMVDEDPIRALGYLCLLGQHRSGYLHDHEQRR
jgi:hypothetical protein